MTSRYPRFEMKVFSLIGGAALVASCSHHLTDTPQESTRVVLLDKREPTLSDLVASIPGKYPDLSSLLGAYLEKGDETQNPRARFPYNTAYSSQGVDVSWVKPLHHYYVSARLSDDGTTATLKFLEPAYYYFNQPSSAAMYQYYQPIEETVSLNFPSVKNFYYEIEGRGKFEASDFALRF